MPSVRREIVLPVSRERAWELLTDPEWLGEDAALDLEPGGEVRAEEHTGVVEAVEPERHLRFRWDDGGAPSEVEWRLDDHPRGTRITVVERRLEPAGFGWAPRMQALAHAALLCPA